MEIAVRPVGNAMEIQVKGRLDNTWSEFFASNLDRLVADGAHDLRVDLSDVSFLSSAGIGVLVRCYNQLHGIAGSFIVVRSSPRVATVLKQTALEAVLCSGANDVTKQGAGSPVPQTVESEGATYDVYDLPSAAGLRCRTVGAPRLFGSGLPLTSSYTPASPRFALGVGALGGHFEECRERFGEFIAVEGAAAYQPAERASPPDYLLCSGEILAEAQMLYGLAFDGTFQQLIRFESHKRSGPLRLSDVVHQCLQINGASLAGIVMIAEVAGIVGAALRRSPALGNAAGSATASAVDWLSFSPDRSLQRTAAIAAGITTSTPRPELAPFLRPMNTADLLGHFHAAVFSYHPVQRGMLDLREAVKHVFERQSLVSVLHLLNDARPGVGIGETELVRGACWVSGVSDITQEAV